MLGPAWRQAGRTRARQSAAAAAHGCCRGLGLDRPARRASIRPSCCCRPFSSGAARARPSRRLSTPRTWTPARGKKTRVSVSLDALPQGLVESPAPPPPPLPDLDHGEPAYPTVVLQAHRNMQKFDKCVLLTRVGGFYELYLHQADEYGPLLDLKVAKKKTAAGPVSMAGFPFVNLEKYLRVLVQDHNCYVAIAEEFPNDPGDKTKSGGLMHDRRVARIITPGTLIDEGFIDPYANNYVMAIHIDHHEPCHSAASATGLGVSSQLAASDSAPIGLAWLDASTGQFYTEATTVASLPTVLSRVGPREIVVDQLLEAQRDHRLFSVLADDKYCITFATGGDFLPVSQWGPMLESEVPDHTAASFTPDEARAGSLLLQYVRDRLQGQSMRLQPPQRHENLSVMAIDSNTMRSLEIKQTIKDAKFQGSLLHATRRTVTKGGARLLAAWLCAPSTDLDTIKARQDLVEHFIQHENLRDEMTMLLRRSHDAQRLVQKFAFGRGDADDLLNLANTIHATRDIVSLLQSPTVDSHESHDAAAAESPASCFRGLLARIELAEPVRLARRILDSIDEEGLDRQHQAVEDQAGELRALAADAVASSAEGGSAADDAAALLPKGGSGSGSGRRKQLSIREHYAEDNLSNFVMRPDASPALRALHDGLAALLRDKAALGESLRARLGAPSLTLKWLPSLSHVCHVRGRDARLASVAALPALGSSRSTRLFVAPEWAALGRRINQARAEVGAEEARLFADLRAAVVRGLVRLRRNAAVLDELDVAASSARLAAEQGLVRPTVDAGTAHTIIGGRHPTVEGGLREQGRNFTRNDCLVGVGVGGPSSSSSSSSSEGRLWLITGPNMAGKSTYLRQVALITVLAQAGCYVPADHCALGLVDAVFARVGGGAGDDLYRDQSTFMVEMLGAARVLRRATPRSLVVMDEVGRGTTPRDGAAVAFACLHHLAVASRCRALFATHFHGLADLAVARGLHVDAGGPVAMYCTDVREDASGGFVYVHRLRRGVNRRSHALKVARLAGLPDAAVAVADELLRGGEEQDEPRKHAQQTREEDGTTGAGGDINL
ncbi:muts domain V [Xylariaceae sp. FL0804]|nr:muts domain V [Xylariaceae sp. FL0804]